MTIFKHLRAGHSRQRELLAGILEATAGQGDAARSFDLLCDEVEAQAAAEEQTFYAELLSLNGSQELSRQAVRAHDEAAVLIGEISGLAPGSDEWREGVARLARMLARHAEAAEEAFALARPLIGAEQAARLGERYLSAKAHWIGAYGRVPAPSTEALRVSPPSLAGVPGGACLSRRVAAVLPNRPRRWIQKFGGPLRNWPRRGGAPALRERSEAAADYGPTLGPTLERTAPTRGR